MAKGISLQAPRPQPSSSRSFTTFTKDSGVLGASGSYLATYNVLKMKVDGVMAHPHEKGPHPPTGHHKTCHIVPLRVVLHGTDLMSLINKP